MNVAALKVIISMCEAACTDGKYIQAHTGCTAIIFPGDPAGEWVGFSRHRGPSFYRRNCGKKSCHPLFSVTENTCGYQLDITV